MRRTGYYASNLRDPERIFDYDPDCREQSAITWKLTGNLGGETFADRTRDLRNERGSYAEG